MNARLDEAATRVAAAERQAQSATAAANQQIAATRADAERQIAQARQTALEAGIVGNVLAAPDLVRFNLVGTDRAPRAYAQVLWSRSRGLVLSAALLPALADGTTYQIWLLSDSGPASAGTVTPDGSGRASFAVENPANLPRAVNGVSVTIESGGAANDARPRRSSSFACNSKLTTSSGLSRDNPQAPSPRRDRDAPAVHRLGDHRRNLLSSSRATAARTRRSPSRRIRSNRR